MTTKVNAGGLFGDRRSRPVARRAIGADCMAWRRMIADHAAAAIVTARAFAEIEPLRKRQELENEYLLPNHLFASSF
jgi:hypothetical protein